MSALAQTFADLTRALSAGTSQGQQVYIGETRVGFIGKWVASATFPIDPAAAWKWSAYGSYGYHPTREDAVRSMIAYLEIEHPKQVEMARRERDAREAVAAMPDDLRALYIDLQDARYSVERERQRSVRRPIDLERAERWEREASAAYGAAIDRQNTARAA